MLARRTGSFSKMATHAEFWAFNDFLRTFLTEVNLSVLKNANWHAMTLRIFLRWLRLDYS